MVEVCAVFCYCLQVDKNSPIEIGSCFKHNTNSFGYFVLYIGNMLNP